MILNHRQILLGLLNEGGLDVWGMWNTEGRREMDTDFGLENLNKTNSKGNLPVEGMTILKWTLHKQSRRMWNGFMEFTTGLFVGCCVHGNEHKNSMNR